MKLPHFTIACRNSAFLLFSAFLLLLLISFPVHAAPNIPLNFDGWIIEALAKLEVTGVTGGFHRHSLPLSRDDVAKIIQNAEARIQAGTVDVSSIDRKLLQKLKREFRSELAQTHAQNSHQTSNKRPTSVSNQNFVERIKKLHQHFKVGFITLSAIARIGSPYILS